VRIVGKRKGAVLIVVLGVLAVLALLATTFATLQATEKQVARNYLDTVRAKMLAQSGVQDAEARLREYFPFRYFNTINPTVPKPWKWWGIDALPYETREPNQQDKLEDTTNPSFAIEDEPIQNPLDSNVTPKLISIEGKKVGLSGFFSTSSYDALHGDNYSLKVSDISGRIYANDGIDGGPQGSVTQNLKRMLNALGAALSIPMLGDKIVNARPPTGYRSPQDLLKALGYDDSLFQRIKNHVTVYAWVDPNCVNPVPFSAPYASSYPVTYYRGNPPVYRFTSSKDCANIDIMRPPDGPPGFMPIIGSSKATENPASCVYGLDSLNPQWIEVVNRAPVNINAASREVLVALLTDIKGVFMSDRRRNNPRWKGDLYLSFKQTNTFSPAGTEGDELGYLMETIPIVGPGGTATDGISAFEIADEMIACRNGQVGKHGNYTPTPNGSCPFGGAFRSWAQFNAFIDYLTGAPGDVSHGGLIWDTRAGLHVDYEEEVDDPAGFGNIVPSDVQREHASKAIADALKANFNPNCHLNVLNPDENLYLRVCKTDLVVMSTEFTFMPTGYFEVEALGRVLRPVDPATRDCYLGDNNLVAQAKVTATYKLYDMYRETNQKQFYAGTLPARTGAFETNSNMSLEIGPEPDNGLFPGNLGAGGDPDNEWDGYIAFPTVGGMGHSAAAHPKNTLTTTLQSSAGQQFNSIAHVHFQYDFDMHHSILDPHEIASRVNGDEHVSNYPSSVNGSDLSYGRPYGPASGPGGGPPANQIPIHRLSRSFRQTLNAASGTVSSPPLPSQAPSDLRIDGAYSERHSAPCYYAYKGGQALWLLFGQGNGAGGLNHAKGMASYWWKPSFYPNLTGKVRSTFDFSRYHDPCGQNVNIWPFAVWYYPSHYTLPLAENQGPAYWHNNQGQFAPSSVVWGSKAWHDISMSNNDPDPNTKKPTYGHNWGDMTRSLNHLDHGPACAGMPSPLRGHRWVCTSWWWDLEGGDQSTRTSKLYINGTDCNSNPWAPKAWTFTSMTAGWNAGWAIMDQWSKHDGGNAADSNQIRLGAASIIANSAKITTPPPGLNGAPPPPAAVIGSYRGNYSGDHTVDEFYCWATKSDADPNTLWQRGRYYKPLDSTYGEGIFVSQAISFVSSNPRTVAPPSAIPTPGGSSGAPGSVPVIPPQIRILGLSWTWYGDGIDPVTGKQTLYDHNNNQFGADVGNGLPDVKPQILCGIRDGAVSYGPFPDDGFSAVKAPDGTIPVIQDPLNAKYFAQFKLTNAGLSSILLSTPVLDDVTIYWDDSRTHLLSYAFDNRSF